MYINMPNFENKENQRLMRSFDMEGFAVYFIRYRTDEKEAQLIEHITLLK